MSLFAFLFDTIRPRANDPGNPKVWLPGVLEGIDRSDGSGKLLPLHESSWNVGPITGTTGYTISKSFADNWATYLEKVQHVDLSQQYPIASPSAPSPMLSLGTTGGGAGDVVIGGLDNVFVHPAQAITPTATGYEVVLQLQLDYYDGSAGRPTLAPLTLDSPYTLEQQLCTSSDGKTCNGNYTNDVVGGGQMSVAISNAWVYATLAVTVAGTGAQRQPAVQITGLVLSGPKPGSTPDLAVKSLTVDARVSSYLLKVWSQMATNAITSDDGRAGIFKSMNAAMNEASFLASLSSTLDHQLVGVLDDLFGAVTGGLPSDDGQAAPNPADQYLYDRVRYALDAPASSLYLPHLLGSVSSPRLEPLTVASIGLPAVTITGLTFDNITLSNVVVKGLTNLQTPSDQIVFGPSDVTFNARLGALTSPPPGVPPPPVNANAQFSTTAMGQTLTGTVTVTVTDGRLAGTATATGTSDADLTITVTSLQIQMPDLTQLVITATLGSAFDGLINGVLNQPGPQNAILNGLNQQLAGQLGTIGAQVTTYARSAIAQQLG